MLIYVNITKLLSAPQGHFDSSYVILQQSADSSLNKEKITTHTAGPFITLRKKTGTRVNRWVKNSVRDGFDLYGTDQSYNYNRTSLQVSRLILN